MSNHEEKKMKVAFGSLQVDVEPMLEWNDLKPEDFSPAPQSDKDNFIQQRKSVSYWSDAWRRLRANKVAMVALGVLVLIIFFAFVGPFIVPYGYDQFNRGAENLHPWHISYKDRQLINAEKEKYTGKATQTPEEIVQEAIDKAAAEGKKLSPREIAVLRAKAKTNTAGANDPEAIVQEAIDKAAAEGKKLSPREIAILRAKAKTNKTTENVAVKVPTDKEIIAQLNIKSQIFGYSDKELQRMEDGEFVFPHVFGTDKFGRDIMVRVMVGTRMSMLVGVCAALLVLIIGATYGSISGYFGGKIDTVMQRIVEIIYSVPEVLIILLLASMLRAPLEAFMSGGGFFGDLATILGSNLISMFIAFALLYWVSMSRIIRGQVLQIKQNEYVTAARALGASSGRVIKKHLLPNCIGQLVVTTCLQIPSAIFLESFLSFLGVGISAPMTSLGSMASEALQGMYTYPYRLLFPGIILSVMILAFNLFGDGLRDALDPRLKK